MKLSRLFKHCMIVFLSRIIVRFHTFLAWKLLEHKKVFILRKLNTSQIYFFELRWSMSFTISLTTSQGASLSDPTSYRATVGSLHYLVLTRSYIYFAINRLSKCIHAPTSIHEEAVKRVLSYLAEMATNAFSPLSHLSIFMPSLIRIGLVKRMTTLPLVHILSTLVNNHLLVFM